MQGKESIKPKFAIFTAPLGAARGRRLVFDAGASWARLTAEEMPGELYRAVFRGRAPRVWLDDKSLTIHYDPHPLLGHGRQGRGGEMAAEISLNDAIPWEIEIRGGAVHLDADLRGLQLLALDIIGGANHLRLSLPEREGTTYIYISGGLKDGIIRRPPEVGVRVRISGGATRLQCDDQRIPSTGTEVVLESANNASATSRYDIRISGGASNLSFIH